MTPLSLLMMPPLFHFIAIDAAIDSFHFAITPLSMIFRHFERHFITLFIDY
jgi:hypothetical protein